MDILFIFLVGAFICSLFFMSIYLNAAKKLGIIAKVNFRTLHSQETPKGGGIVLSVVYILTLTLLAFMGYLNDSNLLFLLLGAGFASLFGFIDDIFNIRAMVKLFAQIFLASWIIFLLVDFPTQNSLIIVSVLLHFLAILFLVWLINVFNFMDGIDGLAASGTFFITSITGSIILYISSIHSDAFLLLLLSVMCLSFLCFNLTRTKVFMGDSGSIFLGYMVGVLFFRTIYETDINYWTWLIVLGYFLTDATATTLYRIVYIKKWYGAHRSHAYQNLARIWDNHRKVSAYILLFHLLWLLPLAWLSFIMPELGFYCYLVAIIPVIAINFIYGPRFSSD